MGNYILYRNKNKHSKYNPLNQKWTPIDQCQHCRDKGKVIECPVCRQHFKFRALGHVDIYLNSDRKTETHIGADIVCKHCHFTQNMDQGRNCWCILKKIMIPKTNLKSTYILEDDKNKLPQDIQDDLKKDKWV